jgi:LPXTG-site transpeptidase (sortase) family protein
MMGPLRPARGAQRLAILVVLSFLVSLAAWPAGPVTAAPRPKPTADAYYAEETGHTLAEPFLSRWVASGGAEELGLPVTEPVAFGGGSTQYFAFGALTEQTADGVAVEPLAAVPAGEELWGATGQDAAGPAPRVAAAKINRYYADHGGDDRFGEPLADASVAGDVAVRWYTHGRLELELDPNAKVEPAPVGEELAERLGVDTEPVERGDLPLFDLTGFDLPEPEPLVEVEDEPLAQAEEEVDAVATGDGTYPEATAPFTPVRIVIPAIGVDAAIEQVGIPGGVMGTPVEPMNVGWYPDISTPGTGTNVVMAAHVDYYTIGPAVFYSLGALGAGDRIYVLGPDGAGITYAVTASWVVGAAAPADGVIGDTGTEALTLITCTGAFDGAEYDSRHIVRAERI